MRTLLVVVALAAICAFVFVPAFADDPWEPGFPNQDQGKSDDPALEPKDNPAVSDPDSDETDPITPPAESPKVKSLKERVAVLEGELASLKEEMTKGLDAERTKADKEVSAIEAEVASQKVALPAALAEVRNANKTWSAGMLSALRTAFAEFKAKLSELRLKPAAPTPAH